jgi:hypothetical protein
VIVRLEAAVPYTVVDGVTVKVFAPEAKDAGDANTKAAKK